MAIACEFIDFIVPIKVIKEKYPGGWEQCLKDHDYSIGRCVWYDQHLFRTGAMSPNDIDHLLREWESKGFTTFGFDENGTEDKWMDICVYEHFLGGATLQCDWIDYDEKSGGVYLKGTEPGELVGRWSFEPTDEIPAWVFQ